MELLRTQKNDVFEIIQKTNLPISDFEWKDVQILDVTERFVDRVVDKLEYKEDNYYFKYDFISKERFDYECSPGRDTYVERGREILWVTILNRTAQWINNLIREIEAPDLWEKFKEYQASFSLMPAEEIVNENIPYTEVERIIEELHTLEGKIIERFELVGEKQQILHNDIEYLIAQTKHQKRPAWVLICIGLIQKIAWDLALDPEKRKVLVNLFETILKPLIPLIAP